MNTPTNSKRGFTIIEVVLVLAIAGLIFLIVFLAVPALQRSQRDTQRKNDLSRLMTSVSNYQSNNKGEVPDSATELATVVSSYVKANGDTFADPGGDDYQVSLQTSGAFSSTVPSSRIYYYVNATCTGENAEGSTGTRKVAARIDLEGGGSYCQNN